MPWNDQRFGTPACVAKRTSVMPSHCFIVADTPGPVGLEAVVAVGKLRELRVAIRKVRRNPSLGNVLVLIIAVLVFFAAIITTIAGVVSALTGTNLLKAIQLNVLPLLGKDATVPIWLLALSSIVALIAIAFVILLALLYRHANKERKRLSDEQFNADGERSKAIVLGNSLARLEKTALAIIGSAEKITTPDKMFDRMIFELFEEIQASDARVVEEKSAQDVLTDLRRSVRTLQAIAGGRPSVTSTLSAFLSVAIDYVRALFDGAITRGTLFVPDATGQKLVLCADTGLSEIEKEASFDFYIGDQPNNDTHRWGVAGFAYKQRTAQICSWNPRTQRFDHPHYKEFDLDLPAGDPFLFRSFIAIPLHADLLLREGSSDSRVLGVLCLDSPHERTFVENRLLNATATRDSIPMPIIRMIYYVLLWRDRILHASMT